MLENNNSQSSVLKKTLNLKKKHLSARSSVAEILKVVLSLWFWSLFKQTLTQQARCCYYAKWNYETRVQQEMPAHKVLH